MVRQRRGRSKLILKKAKQRVGGLRAAAEEEKVEESCVSVEEGRWRGERSTGRPKFELTILIRWKGREAAGEWQVSECLRERFIFYDHSPGPRDAC